MTRKQYKQLAREVRGMLVEDGEFLRPMVQQLLQEALEAEMDQAVGAERYERTEGRIGYRAGYYTRSLVTRVGKLELRVPQDREGRFSTQVFQRYQRSERALVSALAGCTCRGSRRGRSKRSRKLCAGILSARALSARSTRPWTRSLSGSRSDPWRRNIRTLSWTRGMRECGRTG